MTHHRHAERGNVLFIIFIAVALLAALSMTLMSGGGEQAISMSSDKISQELFAQSQSIRSAILECNLINNYGYPPPSEDGEKMIELECQIGDGPTMQNIFTGTANRVVPPPPSTFVDWIYHNDGAGTIYYDIYSLKPADKAVIGALEMLKGRYGTDEATIVNDGTNASLAVYVTKP